MKISYMEREQEKEGGKEGGGERERERSHLKIKRNHDWNKENACVLELKLFFKKVGKSHRDKRRTCINKITEKKLWK